MLKLKEEPQIDTIHVADMEDGDVAIICKWARSMFVGRIVQRYDNALITLGGQCGESWSNFFCTKDRPPETWRVRLLRDGETLINRVKEQ